MKILHCIPGMGGGGAERQLAYLSGQMRGLGWEIHVALSRGGPNLSRLEAGGAQMHWLSGAGNHDPRLAWQLGRIVRRLRPDLVQVWFVQMEVLAGLVSEFFGIPWVVSERSSLLAYPSSLKNHMRVAMAHLADAIVSNSSAGNEYWNDRASKRVPRFVIPNALPFDEIDRTCASVPLPLSIDRDARVVLFAGRFGPEKNVERMVTALCEIVRRPDTVAVLSGEGPLRAVVQRMIAAEKLEDRIFTPGYIADIWSLMKRADVMIAPGLFEGRPNSVLEAMACALPLVVSDIPSHREILDERSAVFVDPANSTALAAAIAGALDDPVAARMRAGVARTRATEWTVHAIAARYDVIYRNVIEGRRSHRRR